MWNFGNFNFLTGIGQLTNMWKNVFGWWTGIDQQPAEPAPTPEEPAPTDQMETLNRIIDLACFLMPNYDYMTMQLSTALDRHQADCIAYSLFVKIACDAVGIPCELIFGTKDVNSIMNGYHVWNCVTICGKRYWTDVTYKNWGDEGCRAFQVPREGQSGMAAYYLIGVDGSTCELQDLDLGLPAKPISTYCMAASIIVGWTERQEYPKCWERVNAELRSAGIL